jgi:hypothetical protein
MSWRSHLEVTENASPQEDFPTGAEIVESVCRSRASVYEEDSREDQHETQSTKEPFLDR